MLRDNKAEMLPPLSVLKFLKTRDAGVYALDGYEDVDSMACSLGKKKKRGKLANFYCIDY